MAAPCHPQVPDLGSFGEIIGVAIGGHFSYNKEWK
jgi:hypothetical protein